VEDLDSEVWGVGRREYAHEGWLRVILWDELRSNGHKIADIVRNAGGQPVLVERLSDLRLVNCCAECFVAVAVTGPIPGGIGMQVIRDLKAKGFKVIACEQGAESWPIKTKCKPLLAGAVQLLDTHGGDFPRTLRQVIEGIVRAEVRKRSEESMVKATMRRMGMVGESAAMLRVFRSVIRCSALGDLPVLITGETGTGKEGLAQALHRLDPKRSQGPFVAVNCGAISAGLAESEFFGHRRGAFTGAERTRKGLVRSAEGGVLFLDEIADMEIALQTRLLRVLQENRVLGVGEDREAQVSVRVVAASNRDLQQMIQQNRFRADLFHRLNVLSVHVPPLRDRPEDLAPLLEHFLQKYRSLNLAGALAAGADFLEVLRQVELPGNVRQLENLVCQVLVRKATNLPLSISDLPVEILLQLLGSEETPGARNLDQLKSIDSNALLTSVIHLLEATGWNLPRSMAICERHALEAALGRTQGNQSETARLLGITPRSVYNKLRKHKMKILA
jgi:DNA-binding NtrC family response regulator